MQCGSALSIASGWQQAGWLPQHTVSAPHAPPPQPSTKPASDDKEDGGDKPKPSTKPAAKDAEDKEEEEEKEEKPAKDGDEEGGKGEDEPPKKQPR